MSSQYRTTEHYLQYCLPTKILKVIFKTAKDIIYRQHDKKVIKKNVPKTILLIWSKNSKFLIKNVMKQK